MNDMDAEEFIGAVGKTDDAPEVVKLLAKLKAPRKPKLKSGELYDHMKFPKEGFVLVFRESEDPKTSQVVLADVQIYSAAKGGFSAFSGKLPDGLVFSDTRTEVRKKLGKPSRSKAQLNKDFWDRKGYIETIQYEQTSGEIYMVSLAMPL
jgi:hypothetical protein